MSKKIEGVHIHVRSADIGDKKKKKEKIEPREKIKASSRRTIADFVWLDESIENDISSPKEKKWKEE